VQKALLLSLLVATVTVPFYAVKAPSTSRAVRRAVTATWVFCILYWLCLLFVFPALTSSTARERQYLMQSP